MPESRNDYHSELIHEVPRNNYAALRAYQSGAPEFEAMVKDTASPFVTIETLSEVAQDLFSIFDSGYSATNKKELTALAAKQDIAGGAAQPMPNLYSDTEPELEGYTPSSRARSPNGPKPAPNG